MQTFIAAIAIFTTGTLCLSMQARTGITKHIISATGPIAENGCVPFIQLAASPACSYKESSINALIHIPGTWSNNTTA